MILLDVKERRGGNKNTQGKPTLILLLDDTLLKNLKIDNMNGNLSKTIDDTSTSNQQDIVYKHNIDGQFKLDNSSRIQTFISSKMTYNMNQ